MTSIKSTKRIMLSQSWVLPRISQNAKAFQKMLYTPQLHKMLGKTVGRRRREGHWMRGGMASPTQWAWVWANSGRWLRTGEPAMLCCRVRHDRVTEQHHKNTTSCWTHPLNCPTDNSKSMSSNQPTSLSSFHILHLVTNTIMLKSP